MREDRFTSRDAGRLVRIREGVKAFVPTPLPPDVPYSMRVIRLLAEAESELGRLEGLGRMLPDPNILIQPFLRREAVLSSKIEGTHTSFSDLLLFEAATKLNDRRDRSAQEVANYVVALDFGLRQCHAQRKIGKKLICDMHQRLMGSAKNKDDVGKFRGHQVHVGGGSAISSARYVPAPAKMLDELFSDLEDFIALEIEIPLLIKLALVHYQFETIHPFVDGNGRIGRLLVTLMLCSENRLTYPLLYLSAFFERFREQYYDLLLGVSQRNEWEKWILFFVQAVRDEARDAISRTDKLFRIKDSYKERFAGSKGSSGPLTLIEKLIESPVLSVPAAQQFLGMTYPSAKQVINRLVDQNMLEPFEYTGRTTYYVASEIISLIEQPQSIEQHELPEALVDVAQ